MLLPRLLAMARTITNHKISMARTSNIISLRGVRNIFQSRQFRSNKLGIASSTTYLELLNRVQIVTELSDSKDIVENIIAMGQPIAVDMEGLVEGRTSMVQVCDVERNIFLFRTGLNSSLYWEGGLASLLESPDVLKVLHASTSDCLSIYKDKVKLWNLFDTAVAFKVLEYQKFGKSMASTPRIGFNPLCQHFGLPENPFKGGLVNVKQSLVSQDDLNDETILYCAWDVDPLLHIYEMLSSSISPSYTHLVTQLSEIEIIRALDPKLAKLKLKNLRNIEACNMFLSGLPSSLAPPELYSKLSHISGHKQIYYSDVDGAANIILDSREKVVTAKNFFSEWGANWENTVECKLVVEVFDNEIVGNVDLNQKIMNAEEEGVAKTNAKEPFDPFTCRKIIDGLLEADCPVVVDFSLYPDCSAVEIYIDTKLNLKVVITQEMVEVGGLGKLMSSNIIKVLPRVDATNVYSALKLLNSYGVTVRKVFDVNTAVKALDYLEHGQSLFKQPSMSVQDMVKSLGLPMMTTKLHWHYMAYLHLHDVLPAQFSEILEDVTTTQLGIGSATESEDVLQYKKKYRQMKTRLDGHTLHLRLIGQVDIVIQRKMKELVMTALLSKDLVMVDYMDFGRCSIVELTSSQAVKTVKDALEQMEQLGLRFSVSCPQELQTVIEEPSRVKVDLRALEIAKENNLKKLSSEVLNLLG